MLTDIWPEQSELNELLITTIEELQQEVTALLEMSKEQKQPTLEALWQTVAEKVKAMKEKAYEVCNYFISVTIKLLQEFFGGFEDWVCEA